MPIILKKLENLENYALGYNRVARVSFADLPSVAAATNALVTLTTGLPVGSVVKNFSHRIITNFDGGVSTETTIIVGHNGATVDDDNSFIAATSLHADATNVPCAIGAGVNNAAGYMNTDVTSIEANFVVTGTGGTSLLTQGEVELRWLELPAAKLSAMFA